MEIFAGQRNQSTSAMRWIHLPGCGNICTSRHKLLGEEQFRGYNASKKEYFHGYKMHVITADGRVVEVERAAAVYASASDPIAFQLLNFDMSAQRELYADKIYNCYIRSRNCNSMPSWMFNPSEKAILKNMIICMSITGYESITDAVLKPILVSLPTEFPHQSTPLRKKASCSKWLASS